MILPLIGDDLGITRDDSHYVLEWRDLDGHRVVFSASRIGDAIYCHFAPEKNSLRVVKIACLDFMDWVFDVCEWCKMLITAASKPSVIRLVDKIGFIPIAESADGKTVFMRER